MKKYAKYKDSGVEWIGEIPEHWDRTAVKRIVAIKITDGPHTTPKFVDSGVPFISAEGVSNGKVDFNKKRGFITIETDEEYSQKCKPKRDDVFIVKSGSTTGKIAYVDFDDNFNIWSPIALVRGDKGKTFGKFIYYAFDSNYFQKQIQLNWSFGTQPNIGMGIIENLLIILPIVEEQKSIANYLDQKTTLLDTLLQKTKQKIGLLQEQRTAIINQAVTKGLTHLPPAEGGTKGVPLKDSGVEWIGEIPESWVVKKLKLVCRIQGRIGFKGYKTSDLVNKGEGAITIGSTHITKKHKIDLTNAVYLNWDKYYESPEIMVKEGDVLFTQRGAYLGKVGIIEENYGEITINPSIILLKEIKINAKYLYYFLTGNYVKNKVDVISSSTAIPMISQSQLSNFYILTPKKEEQKVIVDFIKKVVPKIESKIERAEKKLHLLQEYRQSLISEVVTGKRCVLNEIPIT